MSTTAAAPASFNAEEADNLEDVSFLASQSGHVDCEHPNILADREAVCSQRFAFPAFKQAKFTPPLTPPLVVQHMSTYWAILEKVRGSTLRLTKMDDEIYEHLKTDFPEFDPAKTIDEDEMKSKTGKERWRNFLMKYEKKVDDYNFGTMMRANPKWEYGQDETIFGMI
jgi:hypothetical protein